MSLWSRRTAAALLIALPAGLLTAATASPARAAAVHGSAARPESVASAALLASLGAARTEQLQQAHASTGITYGPVTAEPLTSTMFSAACPSAVCVAPSTQPVDTGATLSVIVQGVPTATTVVPAPSGRNDDVESVACMTATSCVAVGGEASESDDTQQTGLVIPFTITAAGVVTVGTVQHTAPVLHAVACPTTTTCYAVGDVFRTTGMASVVTLTSGSVSSTAALPGVDVASSLACASSTACLALGINGATDTATGSAVSVPLASGTPGAAQTLPTEIFFGLACTSSACYAAGITTDGDVDAALAQVSPTTGAFGTPTVMTGSGEILTGVTCPATSTTCLVAGIVSDGADATLGTIGELTRSATPSLDQVYSVEGTSELDAVACPATSACIAVGGQSTDDGETGAVLLLDELGVSGSGYTPLSPSRVLDTRRDQGGAGSVGPRQTVTLDLAATLPVDVTSVVLNVTGVQATGTTFVTVSPTGQARPDVSNLNLERDLTLPNLVTVPIGADRQVSLFNNAGTADLVADLQGYYSLSGADRLLPLATPKRALDTRDGTGGVAAKPLTAGQTLTLDLSSLAPSGARAVTLNLTAVDGSTNSFVTAFPAGTTRPNASNLNPSGPAAVPNLVTIPLGTGANANKISLYNNVGTVNLVADVQGWYTTSTSAASEVAITPVRLLDTRDARDVTGGRPVGAGGTVTVDLADFVPAGTTAVLVNLTATEPTSITFVTAYSSGAHPLASNLNLVPGQTRPNSVLVPVTSDGTITLYNNLGSTHLLVDVAGAFAAPAA